MGVLDSYVIDNFVIDGGGYKIGDIITSDNYISSIKAIRIVDFSPIYVIIDDSYIYLVPSTTSCYKYNRTSFYLVSSRTDYSFSRNYLQADASKIYTLIRGYATTKAGLQYIDKSTLSLSDIKTWTNSYLNVFCYDKSDSAVTYAISYWDSSYNPYRNYVTYYYNDTWYNLLVCEDSFQINSLVIDGTSIYAYKRTGYLYKIDATTNTLVYSKSIDISQTIDNQMVIRGNYIFIKSSTELKKFDKNGNLIGSLSLNGIIIYGIKDDYIYVRDFKTIYKIDTNLNIIWSKNYDYTIYDIHRYNDYYAILERRDSSYSRVTVVESQTGHPDYSIKIIQ